MINEQDAQEFFAVLVGLALVGCGVLYLLGTFLNWLQKKVYGWFKKK